MNLFLKVSTLVFFVISLNSCIGGSGGGVTASSAVQIASSFSTNVLGKLPSSNTKVAIPTLAGGVTTAALTMSDSKNLAMNKKPTRNIAAGGLNSCVSFLPDPGVDADGDGIAATKNYTFNCSSAIDGSYTYNWSGTMKITDKNDIGGPASQGTKGGYRYEFDMPTYNYSGTDGSSTGASHKGFWDISGTDTVTNYSSDYSGGVKATYVNIPSLGTVNVDYTFTHKMTGTNTHNVGWTSGTVNYTGDYSWNGTFLNESNSGGNTTFAVKTGNATIKFKSDNLVFDTTCTKFYQSGSWILEDSTGGILKFVYGCTTQKVYFNGTEITI